MQALVHCISNLFLQIKFANACFKKTHGFTYKLGCFNVWVHLQARMLKCVCFYIKNVLMCNDLILYTQYPKRCACLRACVCAWIMPTRGNAVYNTNILVLRLLPASGR